MVCIVSPIDFFFWLVGRNSAYVYGPRKWSYYTLLKLLSSSMLVNLCQHQRKNNSSRSFQPATGGEAKTAHVQIQTLFVWPTTFISLVGLSGDNLFLLNRLLGWHSSNDSWPNENPQLKFGHLKCPWLTHRHGSCSLYILRNSTLRKYVRVFPFFQFLKVSWNTF